MSAISKPRIVVVGSSNTDMVVKTGHLPQPGETILGGTFFMNPGGKGANQAVAAARLGGNVTLFTKVGNDIFGDQAKVSFADEGIETSYILSDRNLPSGVALITVDDKGENCIVVAPGANNSLLQDDLEPHSSVIQSSSVLLVQLEIPLPTVKHVIKLAAGNDVSVVLNPAPACLLDDDLLSMVSVITPNQTEAEMLTGIPVSDRRSAELAAVVLAKKGIKTVIVTLGADGALVLHKNVVTMVDAPIVTAVDTTAAGDVFNGALVVALSEKVEMIDAVKFACRAAAISVTRLGAQASAPYRKEIESFL